MPFTLAHPAAVLPLRRLGLPMTALVAGSMAPDVPVFDARYVGYGVTHSWLGVVTVDPVLTVLACLVWYVVVRDALVDLSPRSVRQRLAPHVRLSARQWLLVPVAAALGAATHVTWDAFTHGGRWGVALVPALRTVHGPFHGYQWAQYLSGVTGLLVLSLAVLGFLRRQPVVLRPRRARGWPGRLTSGSAAMVGLFAGAAALAAAAGARGGRVDMLFAAVVTGLVVLVLGLVSVCVLWCAVADRPTA